MSLAAELPFDEPWQARAFALTQSVLDSAGVDQAEFRSRLIDAIAASPTRPYWDSWVMALEHLLLDFILITPDEIEVAAG